MKLLSKFFNRVCTVYTLTTLLLLLLQLAAAGSFDGTVIAPESFLLVVPFSAGVAVAQLIYGAKGIHVAWRAVLHFAVCVLSAFLFLYLPAAHGASASDRFLILLAFSAIYWVCMGIYHAIRAMMRPKDEGKTAYQSVFKK